MTSPIAHSVELTCHPQTPTDVVRGVSARVRRAPGGMLAATFSLDGDLKRLRVPPPQPSRRADGLWQHTCFEVFVALNAAFAYHEFNFAPSGEWAVYAFRGYREREPLPHDAVAPEITVRRSADRLDLDAVVRLAGLSAARLQAPLQLALAAVIEEESGVLSYWALRHPAGKPDFHHRDAFALTLEAAGVDSTSDPG